MYTQCPECSVAFRVTAEVLKKAAGKVRCGGCGIAFSALEHLSEHNPQEPARPDPEPQPAEPESDEPVEIEFEAEAPPQSISAEQSAALLKTLDQLAGSDIRIEDTGVEWRVLNDDDEDSFEFDGEEASDIEVTSTNPIADTGSIKFVIQADGSDTTVNQVMDEPTEVIEEMRFDDNTPLPDDFDVESESSAVAGREIEVAGPNAHPEAEQVDLALGDPDEWEDLLDDLVEPVAAETEEVGAVIDEPGADEAAPIEEAHDEPPDMDTQFAIQAEAMGIDLSGLHKAVDFEEINAEAETEDAIEHKPEQELEIESGDTSIEEDLIAAAFETEAAQEAFTELERQPAGECAAEFGLIADTEKADAGDDEAEPDVAAADEPEGEPEPEPEEAEEFEDEPELEEEPENEELEIAAATEIELDAKLEAEDEVESEDNIETIALEFDDKVEEAIETIAASLDDEPSENQEPLEDQEPEFEDPSDEPIVPEMSEEEKTINMLIDQELFNIAVEDEDGFASTIVQLQPSKEVEGETAEARKEDESPLFESIIMEGETVRAEEELTVDSRRFDDPGVSIPLKQTVSKDIRGGRRNSDPPSIGAIVGVAASVLLLVLQVIHHSREALATVPAFNQTVGPVYRMVGRPLTPSWNISGWRFEATKGSTDEADQLLTIYSRVGNNSDKALPYPLVHLSLTDRYEEIIGSRVLDPGEYLAKDADPRKLVPPGNTFNAVISIDSPSAAATGFKLNVCYRLTGGQLRCAIEDFK
jgi:predicted Zn finger-like uncharacterized protein